MQWFNPSRRIFFLPAWVFALVLLVPISFTFLVNINAFPSIVVSWRML
jgi:hypothetical protein